MGLLPLMAADGTEKPQLTGEAKPAPVVRRERLIGEGDRPRVLLYPGSRMPEAICAAVEELTSTVRKVDTLVGFSHAEWDVLVVWADLDLLRSVNKSLLESSKVGLTLAFVDVSRAVTIEQFDQMWAGQRVAWSVSSTETDRCEQFRPPQTGDEQLDKLIRESLFDVIRQRPNYHVFCSEERTGPRKQLRWTPLAVDSADRALAVRYHREFDGSESRPPIVHRRVIVLPADVRRPEAWVHWAFDTFRQEVPGHFIDMRRWSDDDRWLTRAQQAVRQRHAELLRRRTALIAELDAEHAQLDAEQSAVDDQAAVGERSLYTGQGAGLVAAVAVALNSLGFGVEDRDQSGLTDGKKLEDLRVTDPDAAGWVALVEVRGYGYGGAKPGDFGRLARFNTEFAIEQRRKADRLWYIANHNIKLDPSQRKLPLHNDEALVAERAEEGFATIDSRSIFQLTKRYGDAEPDVKAALRARLRELVGWWPVYWDDENELGNATPSDGDVT